MKMSNGIKPVLFSLPDNKFPTHNAETFSPDGWRARNNVWFVFAWTFSIKNCQAFQDKQIKFRAVEGLLSPKKQQDDAVDLN